MDETSPEEFDLKLEGIGSRISRLEVGLASETSYVNVLVPPVETGFDKGELEWELKTSSKELAVSLGDDEVARFGGLKEGPPDWVAEKKSNCDSWIQLVHEVGSNTRIYGLGEKTGYLEKSGRDYEMWNRDPNGFYTHNEDPLYSSIPFYIVEGRGDKGGFPGVYLHQPEWSNFRVKNGKLQNGWEFLYPPLGLLST
ncbi:MAG: hypothetical protein ACLFVS_04330 [Candidatus Acetothermia bacterium]